MMTQGKSSSITQLAEVFPSWPQEDLQTVLNEAGGDLYVAISRISEGHVSQWSDSTKKTALLTSSTFESKPTRTDRNDRIQRREHSNFGKKNENKVDGSRSQRPVREQRDRVHSTENRNIVPVKVSASTPKSNATKPSIVTEGCSWGDPFKNASLTSAAVADRACKASKTSFADAAASALTEKNKKEIPATPIKTIGSELSNEVKSEAFESKIVEPIVSEDLTESSVVIEVIVPGKEVLSAEAEVAVTSASKVEIFEEEEIVFMPARATPSLTMEQPAVVLPVRTNLRSNINVRFGYDASEDLVAPITSTSVDSSSIENAQPTKTPITVSALESTFAMLSASSVPAAKSPEPILSQPVAEVSAWESSRNSGFGSGPSAGNVSTVYSNFSRVRQPGGWDYEPANSTSTANPSNNAQGSFGPAPGFSGPSSPAAPQRFVSRAAAQYEHANVYNLSNSPTGNTESSPRFSPYEETNAAGNNVSQYYTTRAAPQATPGGYPVYRGGNSLNSSRYGTSNRPYYQQHHSAAHIHHQQSPASQQQSQSSGQYTPYNPHQNYLNNYHHGYPQYSQHADQYAHQQQHQQPQQPYYQPYQPPNQYLSNSNMHHHSHHQNQNHNA